MTQLATDGNGRPVQALRPTTTQSISSTGVASSATAVAAGVSVVRIVATAAINYSLVATATASTVYLPAATVELIRVNTGDVISVIGTATVNITAMG